MKRKKTTIIGDGADVAGEYKRTLMNHRLTILGMFEQSDWDGIIEYITPALKGSPYKHWLNMQLGLACIKKNDFMMARRYLSKAHSHFKDCAMFTFLVAVICIDEGDSIAAIRMLELLRESGAETIISLSTCECCPEELATALVADCSCLLSDCYATLGYTEKAAHHRRLYEEALKNGSGTFMV